MYFDHDIIVKIIAESKKFVTFVTCISNIQQRLIMIMTLEFSDGNQGNKEDEEDDEFPDVSVGKYAFPVSHVDRMHVVTVIFIYFIF